MTSRALIDGFVCPVTGERDWDFIKSYDQPPDGETDFGITDYYRELWRGRSTGHVVNRHAMNLDQLYQGDYWDRTYGGGRIAAIFDKIMALPEDRSDNRSRVALVDGFCRARLLLERDPSLLDVGSGLAVFPAAMREAGWRATALDPDPRAAAHAEDKARVEGWTADFMTDQLDRRFDLVSFNKVLEHVPDPVAMLARTAAVLAPNGVVYVELPDAEGALSVSPDREEFFIEHYCAFSAISFSMLVNRAGFLLIRLDRVVEPSGKYTLRGFMTVPSP